MAEDGTDHGFRDHGLTARRIMRAAASATLATAGEAGQPHAALVTPAVAADGTVLLLLSTLSEHTRQLARDPRCAILFQGAAEGANPQTAPRVSVTGEATRTEDPALRARWLARHPYAAFYADFGDFGLWQVAPAAGLAVLGFGRAHRLDAAALRPDPGAVAALRLAGEGVLDALNADPALPAGIAHRLGGAEGAWRVGEISPDGLDLIDPASERALFLGFPEPVADGPAAVAAVHAALAK